MRSEIFRNFLELFSIDLEGLLNAMSISCIIWNADVLGSIIFGFLWNFSVNFISTFWSGVKPLGLVQVQ